MEAKRKASEETGAIGTSDVSRGHAEGAAAAEEPTEEETVEEKPDGHEHLKKCTACGTWHSKGEQLCPNCGTQFPVDRG